MSRVNSVAKMQPYMPFWLCRFKYKNQKLMKFSNVAIIAIKIFAACLLSASLLVQL